MKSPLTPPVAASRPHELTAHGHTRIDPYYWLREKENPEVRAYLDAENAYTAQEMAHTEQLQQTLYAEMVGRIQETDSTYPVFKSGYYYYSRTAAQKQYPIHCRKKGSMTAAEEILIDENLLAEGQRYFSLGVFTVSPDQSMLAYSVDTSGDERFTIYFKDLRTGELLPDQIPETGFAAVWANDNRTLFYTSTNEAWRSDRLFRHQLGEDPAADPLIFAEDDALYNVFISRSKDGRFLFLTSAGLEATEVYFLDAETPLGKFTRFSSRRPRVRYAIEHRAGFFYIHTNEDAHNYKLLRTPVTDLKQESWQIVRDHDPDFLLEGMELFARFMVLYGRENGLRTVHIHDFDRQITTPLPFPEPVYSYRRDDNPEMDQTQLRLTYLSLTTADTVVDIDMKTGAWHKRKQKPVLGDYQPEDYITERIFAPAEDGTQVPISLVYKKDLVRDGRSPCLLYGYGSYGASQEPRFDMNRLSLLDRGLIFALAHVRGGQEMGRRWYDQGKWLHKKNSFTDFIACARHLIKEKYTSTAQLAAMGRSAGGLLMGGITTMAPELFHVVIAVVPFVDVVTTMLDDTIPLTVAEYDEWGDPHKSDFYHYMLSYSPYDNTTPQAYPHLLITAGLNDPRVQYWEPAKWTARLRAVNRSDNRLLLKVHMGAGHFNSSGRYDYLRDIAFEYAFLLDLLGAREIV